MHRRRNRRPLRELRRGGELEVTRISAETIAGMIYSNLIAVFHRRHDVGDAAFARASPISRARRRPPKRCARSRANSPLRCLRSAFVGTGLLAIPVLAGSGRLLVLRRHSAGPRRLRPKPPNAVGFYSIIGAATVIGFALEFSPINPIQFLVWSAVLNGIVAVPIMGVMMVVVTNSTQMGRFRASRGLAICGWAATGLMALTVVAMFWSILN